MRSNKSLSDRSIVAQLNRKKRQQLRENHHYPRIHQSSYRSIYSLKKDQPSMDDDFDLNLDLTSQKNYEEIKSGNSNPYSPPSEKTNTIVLTPHLNQSQFQELDGKFKQVNSKKVWKRGRLNIILLVAKFIKQLKTHTNALQYKLLNLKMLAIVSDKAADIQNYLDYKQIRKSEQIGEVCLQFLSTTLEGIFGLIPIFSPESRLLLVINIIIYLLTLVNITYIPLKIAFEHVITQYEYLETFFDDFPTMALILTLILSFFTAYYDKGIIYYERQSIVINYLKSGFLLDLTCIVPSYLNLPYMDYFKLVRLIKLRTLLTNLEEVLNFREQIQLHFELVKSIYFMINVCHICACFWFRLGYYEQQGGENNWLMAKGILDAHWLEQYAQSFYYIVVTTLTIGYGDISPQTIYEVIYVIMLAFFVCSILGYTINNIGDVVKAMNEKQLKFSQSMKSINQYLKDYKINEKLSLQIRKYFEYHLKTQVDSNNQGHQMMGQLTWALREQVSIDLYKKYLVKSKIIKLNCSDETINRLCKYVEVVHFFPESEVIALNQLPEHLYYLTEGELEFSVPQTERSVQLTKCKHGQFFGQNEFLLQTPYQYSARATKFSKLLIISHENFLRVIQENKLDYEKYCLLKDCTIIQNQRAFGQICFVCGWVHNFMKCPFIFFQSKKDKILGGNRSSETVSRDNRWVRKKLKRGNTYKNLENVRQSAFSFIIDADINQELNEEQLVLMGFRQNSSIQGSDSVLQVPQKHEVQSQHSTINRRQVRGKKRSYVLMVEKSDTSSSNKRFNIKNSPQFNRTVSQESKNRLLIPPKPVQVESMLNSFNLSPNGTHQKKSGDYDNSPQLTNTPKTQPNKELLKQQSSIVEKLIMMGNENKLNNLEIDEVYNFTNYFPKHNISNIVLHLQDLKSKEKEKEKQSSSPKKDKGSLYSKFQKDTFGRRMGVLLKRVQ